MCFVGSFGVLNASPELPTDSTDGTEVWYYIKFDREWPTGSGARYLYDLGANRPLIAVPPIANRKGILRKVVKTGTDSVYKIVSKRGNSIAYASAAIAGTDIADGRYYSSSSSDQQLYKIDVTETNFYRITRQGTGNGIDKSNSGAFFGAYGSGDGVRAAFIPADSTLVFSTTPTLVRGESNSPDFGEILIGDSLTKTFYAFGYNLSSTDNVTYSLSGDDHFSLTKATFLTPNDDSIVYAPLQVSLATTVAGTISATLTFTHPSVSSATVLSATGATLPVMLSPTEANSDADNWYYIFNNRRMKTGRVIADKDNTIKQTQATGHNTQLWKIVRVASGKYQFINKGTSNKINISGSDISTAATSAGTFAFKEGTGDNAGFYVIYSNDASLSINKKTVTILMCFMVILSQTI